jgi:F-type H+-transporting ATPase subunit gamma
MATLRAVRGRIGSVKKIQKITKAMKMVAAVKLRRAQQNVVAARPYARKLRELLEHLCANTDVSTQPLIAPRAVHTAALVVVTSDRGLCGAFNANLIRAAVNHIGQNYQGMNQEGRVRIFCIGRKGADFFSRRRYTLSGRHVGVYNDLVFDNARAIAREIIELYQNGEIDRVEIAYNEFKSIAQQRIVIEQFLPLPIETVRGDNAKKSRPISTNYLYEPSSRELLDALLPKHLNFHIWRVLLETNAAEQGARMAAMENATENAEELISNLQLQYNKARQASITKELLEVVAGAEALHETA